MATIRSLRKRFDVLAEDASSLTEDVVGGASKAIAENPLIAIGAAFGLGALLAAVLLRRGKRQPDFSWERARIDWQHPTPSGLFV